MPPAATPQPECLSASYRVTRVPALATSDETHAACKIQAVQRGRQARKEKESRRRAREREKKKAKPRARAYPESEVHPSYRYILFPFGDGTPECGFLKDEVLPALVPTLESLLTKVVALNCQHQKSADEGRGRASKPPPPLSPQLDRLDEHNTAEVGAEYSRYRDELQRELDYERTALWAPEPQLPRERLESLGFDPIRFLAVELKKRSKTTRDALLRKQQQQQKAERDHRRSLRDKAGDRARRRSSADRSSRRSSPAALPLDKVASSRRGTLLK
eukprot:TRINITY_DN7096_c0_g1_i6.p1 TRINITY_DN7096_c0_g1~~TRINITY_DN7096_c0_g1_i6.p1  ORF type:complete len:275 (+),score=65.24 TRINITY_DN7096_c0_g1_i6:79-903(+)